MLWSKKGCAYAYEGESGIHERAWLLNGLCASSCFPISIHKDQRRELVPVALTCIFECQSCHMLLSAYFVYFIASTRGGSSAWRVLISEDLLYLAV